MIDPELRAMLVCPVDRSPLADVNDGSRLVCILCGLRYPVIDGIPVMLVDQAERPQDT
ncbi:Trm112 family protein [soil metagenome]